MKRLFIVLLFIVAASKVAIGQFAAELGANIPTLAIKSGGANISTTYKPGFAMGIVTDMRLSRHIYFQPGLFYEMTGAKITSTPKGEYNLNTINVPLNIEYKTGVKCGNRFFFGVGPYVSYNISGYYTTDAYGSIASTSTSLDIGSDKNSNIKAIDAGLGVNVGYLLKKRIYARARYQMGLVNLYPNGDANNSIKASEIGITIGYIFRSCNHISRRDYTGSNDHWRGMSKAKYSRRVKYPR